jgi:hypothetical protein
LNMMFALMAAIAIGLSISFTNYLLILFLLVPFVFFFRKNNTVEIASKITSDSMGLSPSYYACLIIFSLSILGMLCSLVNARTGETIPYFQANLNFYYYFFNFLALISAIVLIFSKSSSLKIKLTLLTIYSLTSHIFRYVIYNVIGTLICGLTYKLLGGYLMVVS